MRRVFIMQKGVVLLLVLAILVSSALALAPPEQTSPVVRRHFAKSAIRLKCISLNSSATGT